MHVYGDTNVCGMHVYGDKNVCGLNDKNVLQEVHYINECMR